MDPTSRKSPQTTAAIRTGVQADLLRYAALLETTPSGLVNDLLEGAFGAVEADQPDQALVVVNQLRRALSKGAHRKLSEKYHRVLAGTQRPETEQAVHYALENTARAVPLLKEARQENLPYEQARPRVFGCVESPLTQEVGSMYESELMTQAAREFYDAEKINSRNYFTAMVRTTELYNKVYALFLREHLAREVVREVPPEFLPRS